MRITNVRRGRIIRMGGACAILLVLLFALHKWSSENVDAEPISALLSDSQPEYYKYHRDVYPTLKSGNKVHQLKKVYLCVSARFGKYS